MARPENVLLEDFDIAFRNFEGRKDDFNPQGHKMFSVLLRPEEADGMEREGWNVKYLKARDEGDDPRPYITVTVSYKMRPPKVFMITSRGKTPLSEPFLKVLDWADVKTVDAIITPSEWTVNGKSGIKAYLQTLVMTIEEDFLELKYADVPEAIDGYSSLEIESGLDEFDPNIIDAEVIEPRAIGR
jgi:hypothetical protein